MIRLASAGDLKFCADLDSKVFGEDANTMYREMEKKFVDKDYKILICEESQVKVGFCVFVSRRWNNTAYIEMLILEEGYRSKGLGKSVVDNVVKICREGNIRRIFCDVGTDNARAVNFYLRNKFSMAGFLKDFLDESRDVVVLSRHI